MTALQSLAALQAAYFLITGIWPLVHMQSFVAVTGPKHDLWLVRTVGVLVTVIGLVLASAAWRDAIPLEIFLLAVGSSAALTSIDVVYVLKGTIDRIYLLDAVGEIVLIAAWLFLWL
jgi:hypothetical protein